jgi:hypothetical protein
LEKIKKSFVCTIECPHCENTINVLKEVKIITPATKADKEEKYFAEKSAQTKL